MGVVKRLFISAASVMPLGHNNPGVAVVATLAQTDDREVVRFMIMRGVGYVHGVMAVVAAAIRGLADGQSLDVFTDVYYVREKVGTERAHRRNDALAALEHEVLQAVKSDKVRVIRTLSDEEWSSVKELHSMARAELERLRPGQRVYPDRG